MLNHVSYVHTSIVEVIVLLLALVVISDQVNTTVSDVNIPLHLSHSLLLQSLLFHGLLLPDVVKALAS